MAQIDGVIKFEASVFSDHRGRLVSFPYDKIGYDAPEFRQELISENIKAGVARGLHFQKPPYSQYKLLTVLSGRIHDIVLDMRKYSPTFGEYQLIDMSADGTYLYVPPYCAHGFITLESYTTVLYKTSEDYYPEHEGGVNIADPALEIPLPATLIQSERDEALPYLCDVESPF